MDGVMFDGSHLIGAAFVRATLAGARFSDATLIRPNFTGADLTDTSFESAKLTDPVFQDAVLIGTDLRGTGIEEGELRGAYLCNVTDTKGTNLVGDCAAANAEHAKRLATLRAVACGKEARAPSIGLASPGPELLS